MTKREVVQEFRLPIQVSNYRGLVLPFPPNSASLEQSNGIIIEVVGGGEIVSLEM